ncbi:hypothetical protein ACF0H5_009160 [Mactra antiquata]
MGSFDLNQNVDENDTKVTDVPKKGNKPTWRHWMLGVVGFLAMCGAAFNRTTVNQYLYRRVQGDVFPNITFTKGVSFCSDQSNDDSNSTDGNDLAKAQQITADYQLVFSILSGGPAVISIALVGSCGMLSVGMMRSITSRMTSPSRQGAAAACISMVETMCHLFSGILANAIYGATVAKVRGATFFVMAAFCGVSIILLIIFKIGTRNEKSKISALKQETIEITAYTQKDKL